METVYVPTFWEVFESQWSVCHVCFIPVMILLQEGSSRSGCGWFQKASGPHFCHSGLMFGAAMLRVRRLELRNRWLVKCRSTGSLILPHQHLRLARYVSVGFPYMYALSPLSFQVTSQNGTVKKASGLAGAFVIRCRAVRFPATLALRLCASWLLEVCWILGSNPQLKMLCSNVPRPRPRFTRR